MTGLRTDISVEALLNSRMVKSPAGTTTDRQVTLTDATVIEVTPTSGISAMHIFNNTGSTINYGGSGVTASTGVRLYNQSTLVMQNPADDFILHFFQNSGGDLTLDIVEFA